MNSRRVREQLLSLACVAFLAVNASAGVVINEIDYDQPLTDEAEFVELYNCSITPVDLTDWTLVLVNGATGTGTVYQTITLFGVLGGNDYYVVCANGANTPGCDQDVTPDTNWIQNGAPDAVALLDAKGMVVDVVSYEGSVPPSYFEGSGDGLEDSGATGNDAMSIRRVPNGGDTNVNNLDFVFGPNSPGAANGADAPECQNSSPLEPHSWGLIKSRFGS